MGLARLRLTTQLTILVIVATLITVSLLVLLLVSGAQTVVEDAIIARNIQLLETTARQLSEPARQSDILAARVLMASIPHPGTIRRVALYSVTGVFLNQEASRDMPPGPQGGDEGLVQTAIKRNQIVERRAAGLITLVAPVSGASGPVGALAMDLPTSDIQAGLLSLRRMALLIAVPIVLAMALAAWVIARYITGPIQALTKAAAAFGRGDLAAPVEVRRAGELGTLADALRQMAHDLLASREQLEAQQQVLEQRVAERTADMQRALAELSASAREREQLNAIVQELSSPVVPVLDGILVMPLIGVIDGPRATMLMGSLLQAIEQHRADYVIMDVTGVPIVDTHVAKVLLNAAGAARLLGTRTILCGLRPELAQTVVGLGLNLSDLVTCADLRSGVDYSMQQRRIASSAA
jgi:anti-anti-sigma regulatory factor/HAMP domain-containing protein